MFRLRFLSRAAHLFMVAALLSLPAEATFHAMQIERVIGGICGDVNQQAIQLRMRVADQNLVSGARLRAWDAAGANPVVVVDFGANVTNGSGGSRVLSESVAFGTGQDPAEDFFLTALIPASYLRAGRLTFESDGGTIYWSLAWGGALYTGTNTGNTFNDADGNFSPVFPGPLPWTTGRALFFDGAFGDMSTNNAADYALTAAEAVFTNNAGANGTVTDCLFGDGFETAGTTGWSATFPP